MLPYQNKTLGIEQRIDDLLGRMTLEEKIHMCSGSTPMEVGGIERLDIPLLQMADGPQGVRLPKPRTEKGEQATAFPCGIALAACADPKLAEKYGEGIARDAAAVNVQASLGPGFNLMRTPLNGRNFEYYGEDPVLSGKTAAGYVRGCQAHHVAATPKHLALNNQEICRTTGSSDIDERTLRELYLTSFEIVTKESQPWLMMSSYNRINGQYAAECGLTQELIVKREWGFDGVMVSDWGGAHDTIGCALGGLDLEMGGPGYWLGVERLLPCVQNGSVPESVIDDKVRRVLRLMFRTGVMDRELPQEQLGGAPQRAIAEEVAAAGIVLLKNADSFLPLNPAKTRKVVVAGPNADFRHHRGTLELQGGSGAVFSDREVTVLAGLREYGEKHGFSVEYFPVLKFDHDNSCPVGLFGDRGVHCVYFHDEAEMQNNRNAVFEESSQEGVWSFIGAGAQTAGGSMDQLPKDHFGVRMSAKLNPPSDKAAELVITAQHGGLRVKVGGKIVIEQGHTSLLAKKYQFAPGEARGAEVEIEYFAYAACAARLSLGWNELDHTAGVAALLTAAKSADAVVFVGGTHHLYDKEALGWGDVVTADIPDLKLPGGQDALIQEIAKVTDKVAVVLLNGSVVEVEGWIEKVPALLEAWYPGEAGGRVVAEMLFGERNPSGHLPCTWGKRLVDYACHANGDYPGSRKAADPRVAYHEGLFIGYRHFDRAGIEPRFAFGHGLSYSTFEFELLQVEQLESATLRAKVAAKVKVKNTSGRAGAALVQLYVGAIDPAVERPLKELKAFAKVALQPGEERELSFQLNWRDFACWLPSSKRWEVPAGRYRISAATDAGHLFGEEIVEFRD